MAQAGTLPVAQDQAQTGQQSLARVIIASSLGTMIEWYDFYIFGSLTFVIAPYFFGTTDVTKSVLLWLATYATGFLVRPFGAVIFGRVGDMIGRKYTFLVTLTIMGLSTAAIGLLPGVNTISWIGIVLLLLRLLEGLALGGEYGGAATYIAEHAPQGRRGFYTSFIQITATAGLLLSLLVILGLRVGLGEQTFADWGWRVAFLLSAVLVVISFYIRLSLRESPMFARLKESGKTSKNPLAESFRNPENRRLVLLALFGATAGQGVVWYTGQFYSLTFLQGVMKVDFRTANLVVAAALLLGTPFFVLMGSLSDKIGRKPLIMAGCLIAALAYYPLFNVLDASKDAPLMMVLVLFVMVIFVTMVYGPIAAFLVEMFPTRIRYTSMSVPYHFGNGWFGGLLPVIATALVTATGNIYAGLIFPIAVALMTFVIGMLFVKDTKNVDIAAAD